MLDSELHGEDARAAADWMTVWLERNRERVGEVLFRELQKIDPDVVGGILALSVRADFPVSDGREARVLGLISVGDLSPLNVEEALEAALRAVRAMRGKPS